MNLVHKIKENLKNDSYKIPCFFGITLTAATEPFAWNSDGSFDYSFSFLFPLVFSTAATIGYTLDRFLRIYCFNKNESSGKGYVTMRDVGKRAREYFFPLAEVVSEDS